MLFDEPLHGLTSRQEQPNASFEGEWSEGWDLFQEGHAQRDGFFDISNGVDETEGVGVCEIDEMLVEDFIGAITHQQVSKGSGSVLFLFHNAPRLFGDGLEVFFRELI